MIIGYGRVSTAEQNKNLQVDALEKAGCTKSFYDTISGASRSRPELHNMLNILRSGDTLVVWKLDRLGRSVSHLISIIELLEAKGVLFKSITEGFDTSNPGGKFFFNIMAALAEFERQIIVQRTKAGLQAAKNRGVKLGRRSKLNNKQVSAARKMLNEGEAYRDIAELFNVPRKTLYRIIPRSELNE